MPKTTISFETVKKIGLALPGVGEGTAYGSPALKIRGHILAALPINPSAEPGSLMVRVDDRDRAELLAAAPEIYYLTPHYEPYNAVLVRLARVDQGVLRDLLGMAHKFVTSQSSPRTPGRKRRRR
jgi:hypothetical protein